MTCWCCRDAPKAAAATPCTPESAVGTAGTFGTPTFPTAQSPQFPTLQATPFSEHVTSLVRCDYSSILSEYGFEAIDDFELYSEEDLVAMGFKKVHARKLLRAASVQLSTSASSVAGSSRLSLTPVPVQ